MPGNPLEFRKSLLSFEGRISRSQYWLYSALSILISVVALLVIMKLPPLANAIGTMSTYVFLVWSSYALAVKRYHDRGKSGWWTLIGLVPIVGQIIVMAECCFFAGTREVNRFGYPVNGR